MAEANTSEIVLLPKAMGVLEGVPMGVTGLGAGMTMPPNPAPPPPGIPTLKGAKGCEGAAPPPPPMPRKSNPLPLETAVGGGGAGAARNEKPPAVGGEGGH